MASSPRHKGMLLILLLCSSEVVLVAQRFKGSPKLVWQGKKQREREKERDRERESERERNLQHPATTEDSTSEQSIGHGSGKCDQLYQQCVAKAIGHKSPQKYGFKWYAWGSAILLTILAGFVWAEWGLPACPGFHSGVSMFGVFIRALLSNMPLVAYYFGYASCSLGLPWSMHLAYTVACVCACPLCCGLHSTVVKVRANAEIPLLGCKGSLLAHFYVYMSTMLLLYDQYGDLMSSAIALACGWQHAWLMVVVYFYGLLMQVVVSSMTAGKTGGLAVVLAYSPEAAADSSDPDAKQFAATMGVMSLLTENIPQSILQIWFAHEMNPSVMVYISTAISILMASKGFYKGVRFLAQQKVAVVPAE